MKRLFCLLLAGILILPLLAGCGGGGSAPNLAASGLSGGGRALVHLQWPSRSRLVPQASNSVVLTIKKGDASLGSRTLTRPDGDGAVVSTAEFTNLPVGTFTLKATAYPNADGTGTAQATASQDLTITDGQTASPTITMASTIDHIVVTAENGTTGILLGHTTHTSQLIATPKDAAGNTVLTTAANLSWQSSDTNKVTINSSGLATGVAYGGATITATDSEHGKSGTLDLCVVKILVADSSKPQLLGLSDMNGTYKASYTTGLSSTFGVFVDSNDKIYIADSGHNQIIRMDDLGGTNKVTYSTGLAFPTGVFVDSGGKIYIADYSNNQIVRMDDMSGTNRVTYGTGLSGPTGIFVDGNSKIYVANWGGSNIVRMDDMSGTNKVTYSTGISHCGHIFVDYSGKIYVANEGTSGTDSSLIRMDDMSGTNLVTNTTATTQPFGITMDMEGKIYIADRLTHQIVRMDDMSGTNKVTYSAGLSSACDIVVLTNVY